MTRMITRLSVVALLAFTACGGDDEPVSYSAPVGIDLKADADKVVGSAITDNKNINTETGNPYGAYITAARDKLGHDPGRIEVTSVALLLGASSTGVAALNEIFDGLVNVTFEMNTTADTIPVAHVIVDANTVGPGPVDMEIDFGASAIAPANLADLVAGNFKVVYNGVVKSGYAATAAKADLQITFTFESFEQ